MREDSCSLSTSRYLSRNLYLLREDDVLFVWCDDEECPNLLMEWRERHFTPASIHYLLWLERSLNNYANTKRLVFLRTLLHTITFDNLFTE